jgi:hypothetical protein
VHSRPFWLVLTPLRRLIRNRSIATSHGGAQWGLGNVQQMAKVTEFDLDFIRKIMAQSEQAVLALGNSDGLEPPVWDDTVQSFRHKRKDASQLIFLKCVRYMSLLNASGVLFLNRLMQEMGILCRCMDESFEDALFFLHDLGADGSLNDRQVEVLTDFYQEEFVDESVGMKVNNERRRTPRKYIRSAVANFKENEINPNDHSRMSKTIYGGYSGYVHGAYPRIMELYDGETMQYRTQGMQNAKHIDGASQQLVDYVYRGIIFGQYVAKKLGRTDVLERIFEIGQAMEMHYPHLAQDPCASLAALKRKR